MKLEQIYCWLVVNDDADRFNEAGEVVKSATPVDDSQTIAYRNAMGYNIIMNSSRPAISPPIGACGFRH
jgi:hypothetical protein